MKRTLLAPLALLVAALPAAAQDATPKVDTTPKVSGLLQVWYTQMLDNNLRLDSKVGGYYNLRSEFQENGFSIRRSEIKVSGTIMDGITYEVMIDPSITSKANSGAGTNNVVANSNILQDASITYKSNFGVDFKVGQMRIFQTLEGNTSAAELLFAERGQMTRVFGDIRDRGAAATLNFGDKNFGGKATLAVFNGGVKVNENQGNASKDFVGRLEFNIGSTQKFGIYTLQGSTDQADTKGVAGVGTLPATWTAAGVTSQDVYDNKDKTSNLGAFYALQSGPWIAQAEVMSGVLGRRFPAFATFGREHLDQKFLGFMATLGYTVGHSTFLLRYDTLNYNQGDKWYTATSPYVTTTPTFGTVDASPKFTEVTAGYLYAFKPESLKAANIKVNYIHRSKNFLAPRVGETGEQGGDTLVAAFQVAF